jgi:hypothetical protein
VGKFEGWLRVMSDFVCRSRSRSGDGETGRFSAGTLSRIRKRLGSLASLSDLADVAKDAKSTKSGN